MYILSRTIFLLCFWYFPDVRPRLRWAASTASTIEFDCRKKRALEYDNNDDGNKEQLENSPSFKRQRLSTNHDDEEIIIKKNISYRR